MSDQDVLALGHQLSSLRELGGLGYVNCTPEPIEALSCADDSIWRAEFFASSKHADAFGQALDCPHQVEYIDRQYSAVGITFTQCCRLMGVEGLYRVSWFADDEIERARKSSLRRGDRP